MSDVKMVYEAVNEMKREFEALKSKAEDSKAVMAKIAQMLEGGSLLGQAGELLAEGVNVKLGGAFQQLADKFDQMAGQLDQAMQDFVADDTKSAGLFK